MKAAIDRPDPKPSSTKKVAVPLRTGKIHTTRGSAAQILRNVGVTAADQRLADKALKIAAGRPKAETLSAPRDKRVVAAKRVQPATTKKR